MTPGLPCGPAGPAGPAAGGFRPAKIAFPDEFEPAERGPWSNAPAPALACPRLVAAAARDDVLEFAALALTPDVDEPPTLPATRTPPARRAPESAVLLCVARITAGNGALAG